MINYKLLYYANYKSIDNDLLRLEIHKDYGSSSIIDAPQEIKLCTNPFNVEFPVIKNKLEVIRSSGAQLDLFCTEGSQFINLYTAKIKEYKVIFKMNDKIVWSGFLDTENYSEEFSVSKNYPIQFTANDGFKILERINFFENTGLIPLIKNKEILSQWDVIKKCITNMGLDFMNLYVGCATTANEFIIETNETIFHKTYVNTNNYINEDGVSENCLDVLEWNLSPYGLFIQKYNNDIYILDYQTILKKMNVKCYDNSFNYISSSNYDFYSGDYDTIGVKSSDSTLSIINSFNKGKIVYSPYIQEDIADFELNKEDFTDYKYETLWNNSDYGHKRKYYNKTTYIENYVTNWCDGFITNEVGTGIKNLDETNQYIELITADPSSMFDPWGNNYWQALNSSEWHEEILKFKVNPVYLTSSKDYFLKIDAQCKFTYKQSEQQSISYEKNQFLHRTVIPIVIKIGDLYYKDYDNEQTFVTEKSTSVLVFGNDTEQTTDIKDNWQPLLNVSREGYTHGYYKPLHGKLIPLKDINGGLIEFYIKRGAEAKIYGSSDNKYVNYQNACWPNKGRARILLKDIKLSICDKDGKEVDNKDIEISGKILDDFENDADDIKTFHGTNKTVNKDGTDNINADNPLMLGSLMYKNNNGVFKNIKGWQRNIKTSTIETLLLTSLISNYQYKTLQLDCKLNYINNQISYVTYLSQFNNKKFLISGSNINYSEKLNECTLIEINEDLNI